MFCGAEFVNAFEMHGERNRKKKIVSNTNSEKYLVKQAYGHILD